ncbi:MAG TPA: cation diffusion facilitator family transporter [Burkholderiales bacterium]|nr:cation diffusion facilitator family transporter [Burkholderiales bacterium]
MKPVLRMALLSIATSVATLGLKFGAWLLTGSVGLLSDALEAFVNLAAGLIAFGALTVAEQPADDRHSYGHDKAEYFSSGVEGVLILVAAASIVYTAADRFLHPAALENLGPGLLVGLLAAAMNFTTSRIMAKVGREHDSITIEADARHLMTDVWTSAGVLGGLAVVMFVPQWHMLDPLIALAVGVHIVFTGVELLRRTIDGLMDTALPPDEIAQTGRLIEAELPAGASFHDLRTRKAGPRRFIEFHLLVPGRTSVHDSHALCDRIERAIEVRLSRTSVTIHVEPAETETPATDDVARGNG